MFLEEYIEKNEEIQEALAFLEEVAQDASATYPGSPGMDITVEVMESEYALTRALQLITVDQLWENQIDMYGHKTPLYKPATVRKKAKLPDQTPDKLVNYTYAWSFKFMNQGIYIWVDAASDTFTFENTLALPYFAFIPDEVIGMTQDNFDLYESGMSYMVEQEQKAYIQRRIDESPYADTIRGLEYLGVDLSQYIDL